MKKYLFVILLFLSFALPSAWASVTMPATRDVGEVSVLDIVYREAKKLHADVEQIREAMGAPEVPQLDVKFLNVELRHVYFATQVTFQKADKLAQKLANAGPGWSPYPQGEVETQVDVFDLIQATREQMAKVRLALNINEHIDMPPLETDASMVDIMWQVGLTGNQINAILEPRVEWANIYDQLALSISYMSGVLPDDKRFPQLPAIQAKVGTSEVLNNLDSIRILLQKIGDRHGVSILRTEHGSGAAFDAGLSTVAISDIMTIINADLAELTLQLNPDEAGGMPSYPRPEVIELHHVDQLLRVLGQQLIQLKKPENGQNVSLL